MKQDMFFRAISRHTAQSPNKSGEKEKNQCPREEMFSDSFAKTRGRDEG
jgi:hypothetical protein